MRALAVVLAAVLTAPACASEPSPLLSSPFSSVRAPALAFSAEASRAATAAALPLPAPISPFAAPPVAPTAPLALPPDETIRLAAAGDVMVHQVIKYTARAQSEPDPESPAATANNAGWNSLFEDVADVLHLADISFANLETPIMEAPTGDPWFLSSGAFPNFKAPPALPAALKWASVRVVSVANNHSYDQGAPGITQTLAAVREVGLVPIGAGADRQEAEAPVILEVRGIKVGYLGATGFLNTPTSFARGEPQVAMITEGSLPAWRERVRALKSRTDLVVVSCHWGEEESTTPRDREVRLARALCEAGADVILGHHPHVLQPIEVWTGKDGRRAVIAYSLGNLVTGNPKPSWRTGAILVIEAARTGGGPVGLTGFGWVPTWCRADSSAMRVVNSDRMIRTAKTALADPSLSPEAVERWKTLRTHHEKQVATVRSVLGAPWVALPATGHDTRRTAFETLGPPRP